MTGINVDIRKSEQCAMESQQSEAGRRKEYKEGRRLRMLSQAFVVDLLQPGAVRLFVALCLGKLSVGYILGLLECFRLGAALCFFFCDV